VTNKKSKNKHMKKAFINISKIYGILDSKVQKVSGSEMSQLNTIANGFLIVENGRITEIGQMTDFQENHLEMIDLNGASVLPTYCDSHTHIVFAEPREQEFEMKIQGKTYEEIAASGGGILNSARKLGELSFDELYDKSARRLSEVIKMGTGAIEIKSGYGLTIESELMMLKVIQKLKQNFKIPIKATFLGAHAIPTLYKSNPQAYITEVVIPAIDMVVREGLADFVDIFIEKNYFSLEMAQTILDHSEKYGLKPKLHVNQLSNFGGLQLAVDRKALSADHLEEMTDIEIAYLKDEITMPTALPSCSFFLRIPYAPARRMIDSGLPIALASDFNPGSTPSGNMNFVLSLACIYQRMTPIEVFHAATINGAYAMDLSQEVGSLSIGKLANFIVSSELQSIASIPYSFGKNIIDSVYIQGEKF
jgi:imidazolonepropionase